VHLRLVPQPCLEAHGRLGRGPRPYGRDVHAELGVAADVAGRLGLGGQARGGALRELAQPLGEKRLVRVELGRDRRPGRVARPDRVGVDVEEAGLDPAVQRGPVDAERPGGGADRVALAELVAR
jgi:hypothetical protein